MAGLMEIHQDCHELTQAEGSFPAVLAFPGGNERLAKIVNIAE
jgi:hypothetical protein